MLILQTVVPAKSAVCLLTKTQNRNSVNTDAHTRTPKAGVKQHKIFESELFGSNNFILQIIFLIVMKGLQSIC